MASRKLILLTLIPVVIVALLVGFRPDRAARVATGAVAHDVCSKTFISGLDPQMVFAETMTRPGIRWLKSAFRYDVDRTGKSVQASLVGLLGSRAWFHDGFGCIVVRDGAEPYLLKTNMAELKASSAAPWLADIAGPAVVEPSDARLKAALDHAFAEPEAPPYRRTKAVVVVQNGNVIAERYASGIGVDTPLLGFSVTKSVVNALLGILVRQGRLSVAQPAPVAQWREATDPRHAITIEQLMRMTSGLALDETNSGFDATSQMLYLYGDMAGFAASAAVVAAPGMRWAYSSASTQLLARIIRDTVGGPEQTLAFAWRELFDPLGMRSMTLEFDTTGTLQGSAYMFAGARDWARFGLLYLNDGVIAGHRLLPEGWVDLSARATLDTDYGAGFWTNRSDHAHAKGRVRLGIPHDAFFASGNLGQRIVVLPTQQLVVVRLGDAVDPSGDIRGLGRLVGEVIAATLPGP